MSRQYLAVVDKKEVLGPEIFRLTFRVPEIAAGGRPGQFVMLRSGRSLDPLLSRPFSLHQTMSDGRIQVLFKVIGEGTRRLAALSVGAAVSVVGPLGKGFSLEPPPFHGRLGLVGGGLGMAPLFFLARELMRQFPQHPLDILLGARNSQELDRLLTDFRYLGLEPNVATDDGSLGYHGLITELLDQHWGDDGFKRQVYCCGPWPMMAAVAARCDQHSWPCQVSLETMMACGFSACLGCAVSGRSITERYLHVCKDGPVFNAEDIDWS